MKYTAVGLSAFMLLLSFTACNMGETGKARIVKAQGHVSAADLDVLEVWAPFGYYCIDWRMTLPDSGQAFLTSKSCNKGKLMLNSFQIMNQFISRNAFDIDSLNKSLEKIPPEESRLIYKRSMENAEKADALVLHYIIFTKEKKLAGDTAALLQRGMQQFENR